MAYQKTVWKDQDVENPRTYVERDNGDGTVTLLDAFGTVTELGTPVNAANMNKIEDALEDVDYRINNISLRNVGEIIKSTIPLTDAGLHLLDGALISGSGVYMAFVNFIASLVSVYPNLFISENDWQTSVSTYGVCGKFVYDSVNNTVRLPKITGIIEGTTNTNALGDLVEAGAPQIFSSSNTYWVGRQGNGDPDGSGDTGGQPGGYVRSSIQLNTTGQSSIYGKSDTIQPQTIKALYYIVVANSIKTNIQVDIDEIVTDLNAKADKSNFQVVSELPSVPDENTFYFIPEE